MTTEVQELLDALDEIKSRRKLTQISKQALIDQVLTPEIKARLAEIDEEFEPQETIGAELERSITDEIKAKVIETGATVKSKHLQAVYRHGSITWDTKFLEGLSAVIPDVNRARREGAPSVSIRPIGE